MPKVEIYTEAQYERALDRGGSSVRHSGGDGRRGGTGHALVGYRIMGAKAEAGSHANRLIRPPSGLEVEEWT